MAGSSPPLPRPLRGPRALAVLAVLGTLLATLLVTSVSVPLTGDPSADPAAAPHGLLAAGEARPGWHAPVAGAGPQDVRRAFAAPLQPWGRGHRGVDLATGSGAVRSPADGTVRFAGGVVDRPVLTIAHDDGLVSSFEPVTALVPVGARVSAGEVVGTADPLGAHCLVPCVHWGVRREDGWRVGGALFDRYVDPLWLIGWSGPSVLWPQHGPRPPGVPAAAGPAPSGPS